MCIFAEKEHSLSVFFASYILFICIKVILALLQRNNKKYRSTMRCCARTRVVDSFFFILWQEN